MEILEIAYPHANTHTRAHSKHRFLALSTKLSGIGYASEGALIAAVHQHGQCPLEGLGTNKTVDAA